MTKCILIIWTSPHIEEAQLLIKELLDQRLIACASFFPVESMFHWKGVIEHVREVKVFLKTEQMCFSAICNFLKERSKYDVSEILQIPVEKGNLAYLNWVTESCRSPLC